MVQRSNMWYAYFRFYVDEDDIRTGLDTYCKEWENMFAVGYNYREYKCFVDNLGGFEHWVGDMSGYISQDREVGFIDGSPSDNVYDSTLLMGATRMITPNIKMLHALKAPLGVIIRKLIAEAAAGANIDIHFSSTFVLEHNFYVAYDESKIEVCTHSGAITDDSTADSYSVTMDLNSNKLVTPIIDSSANVTDPEKCINGNYKNYAIFEDQRASTTWLIFDFSTPHHFFNITGKVFNKSVGDNVNWYFQGSADKATWETIKSKTIGHGVVNWWDEYEDIDATYRYIRLITSETTSEPAWLYQLNFGIN